MASVMTTVTSPAAAGLRGRPPAAPAAGLPTPPWVRLLLWTSAAVLAAFVGFIAVRTEPRYVPVLDAGLGNLVLVLPALVFATRAVLVAADRVPFGLLAAGATSFAAGNVVYLTYVHHHAAPPFPSWADAGYLGTYPCFVAAVLLLVRRELGRLGRGVLLDGLVGVLGASAAGSLLLAPILTGAEGGPAAVAVAAAYPLGDLLLLAMVVGVFGLSAGRLSPRWLWLGAGLVTYAAADTIYLVRVATDSYEVGAPLDALWALGMTVMAFGAWSPGARRRPAAVGPATLAVPAAFTLVAVSVLVAASSTQVPTYTVLLATATLLATLMRTAVAFGDLRSLADARTQARTDDLTGLANRRAFTEELAATLEGPRRPTGGAVLLLDLDGFKDINDTLGHHVGDELLRLLGGRLKGQMRSGERLARIGGDEFAVLLPDADEEGAVAAARRVVAAVVAPMDLEDVRLHVGGSIGVALYPQHADDGNGLLQRADVAMYEAKGRGHDVAVYEPGRDLHSPERLRLAEQLRGAVDDDAFVVHYQPLVDLRSGAVTGLEALVRWQHPERGLLYPDAFLPLVEQTGLLHRLTLTVLRAAIAECRRWRLAGLDLSVSVNLSAPSLLDERLPETVRGLLADEEIPADALVLEITEDTLMVDPGRAVGTMHALRRLGVRLSVDDYGTGYSSLSYLRNLPVDELKLDRSFVSDLRPGSPDAAIVRSTVELAHALGLRIVAEGVESAASLAMLRALGCDGVQGYHVSRPVPAAELVGWLEARATRLWGAGVDIAPALSPAIALPAGPAVHL
jgi:diguanylate cyclase (GGDEF)-like protein